MQYTSSESDGDYRCCVKFSMDIGVIRPGRVSKKRAYS